MSSPKDELSFIMLKVIDVRNSQLNIDQVFMIKRQPHITWLYISFTISVDGESLRSPCDSHWDAVSRILCYVKTTPNQGVLYRNRGDTQIVGYSDLDWAGLPTNGHSTSRYCVYWVA